MYRGFAIALYSSLLLFITGPAVYSGDSSIIYGICSDRCSGFTGQAKYRCMQTCVSSMKKNYRDTRKVSEKVKECENICSAFKGVDNVKCMRICLEKNREAGKKQPDYKKNRPVTADDVCEDRCRGLDASFKYECIKKCKRDLKKDRKRGVNVW